MTFIDHKEDDGLIIKPKVAHQMINRSDSILEFIVISSPESHKDKHIVF